MWATANVVLVVIAASVVAVNARMDARYFAGHHGEPWRVVAADVAKNQKSGDLILIPTTNRSTEAAFKYYYFRASQPNQTSSPIELPQEISNALAAGNLGADAEARLVLTFSQFLGNHPRLWVIIPSGEDESLRSRLFAAMPTRLTFSGERVFTGEQVTVRVSLWVESGP
jgi:hypothetical protein